MNIVIILFLAFVVITSSIGIAYALTQLGVGDDVYVDTGIEIQLDGETGNHHISQSGDIITITENGKPVSLPSSAAMAGSSDTFSLLNTQQTFTQPRTFGAPSGIISSTNFQGQVNPGRALNQINGYNFQGYDSAGTVSVYASLQAISEGVTPGNHQGGLRYYVTDQPDGVASLYLALNPGSSNEVRIHKDMRLINSDLILTGTSKITSGGDICIGSCP